MVDTLDCPVDMNMSYMYIATKILHLGYLFDQAHDMRCIVLPAADCSHEESIQHFEAQSGGN